MTVKLKNDKKSFSAILGADVFIYETSSKEKIVVENCLVIDGHYFETEDLYDGLCDIDRIWWQRDTPEAIMMMKYGIISRPGGREYPASKGPNFDAFFAIVKKHIE